MSTAGLADGIFCSSFAAADGLCFATEHCFTKMTNGISTVGYTGVSFNFWWVCGGGTGKHGEVYYSTNGGTNWTQITLPISQYNNQSSWTQQTITMAAFDNQADLRFGFRFFNTANFNPVTDPGFSIDDVTITAPGCTPSASTNNVSICEGETYFAQGNFQTNPGTYYDTLTNFCGLDSIVTTNLTVNPLDLGYTVAGNTITSTASPATYQWINCGTTSAIPGATMQSYTPGANGQYAVIVTMGSCSDTSNCVNITGIGIHEFLQQEYLVSPNPFNQQTSIRLPEFSGDISQMRINITDAIGRLVNPEIRLNKNEIIIQRGNLPSGVYFVQLTSGNKRLAQLKIIAD
jgi:hypothetical protein